VELTVQATALREQQKLQRRVRQAERLQHRVRQPEQLTELIPYLLSESLLKV